MAIILTHILDLLVVLLLFTILNIHAHDQTSALAMFTIIFSLGGETEVIFIRYEYRQVPLPVVATFDSI